jgi:multidrug resistance efflux pump
MADIPIERKPGRVRPLFVVLLLIVLIAAGWYWWMR